MADELEKVDKSKEQDVSMVHDAYLRPIEIKIRLVPGGPETPFYVGESDGGDEFWGWNERLSEFIRIASLRQTDSSQKLPEKNLTNFKTELIAQCLKDANGKLVPADTIRGWGMSLKDHLYKLCLEQNGLGPKSAEQAKKESGDTATTGGG